MQIREARFPEELDLVRALFREYAAGLGIDLAFQDFEAELAGLPGKYAIPRGRILLASSDEQIVGCAALRPLDGDICEMKRLYVRPDGRGRHLGRRLALRVCEVAKQAGYSRIRLDTLADMEPAQRLYESLGFKPIPAYAFNPIAGAKFMELDLRGPGPV